MYHLFLDDERKPSQVTWVQLPLVEWTIVRNFEQMTKLVTERGLPATVSFDHDLAEEHYRPSMYAADGHYNQYYGDGTFKEKTGYECAKWLVMYCADRGLAFPTYYVHTLNPIGLENIKSYIKSYQNICNLTAPTKPS